MTVVGPVAWLRNNLFNTWYNALLTIAVIWTLLEIIPRLLSWLVVQAHGFDAPVQECRADYGGACWAFISEKLRFIIFGTFPYDEQWRPSPPSRSSSGYWP